MKRIAKVLLLVSLPLTILSCTNKTDKKELEPSFENVFSETNINSLKNTLKSISSISSHSKGIGYSSTYAYSCYEHNVEFSDSEPENLYYFLNNEGFTSDSNGNRLNDDDIKRIDLLVKEDSYYLYMYSTEIPPEFRPQKTSITLGQIEKNYNLKTRMINCIEACKSDIELMIVFIAGPSFTLSDLSGYTCSLNIQRDGGKYIISFSGEFLIIKQYAQYKYVVSQGTKLYLNEFLVQEKMEYEYSCESWYKGKNTDFFTDKGETIYEYNKSITRKTPSDFGWN